MKKGIKLGLTVYLAAVASLPITEYIDQGRKTGEWNPLTQEPSQSMENLSECVYFGFPSSTCWELPNALENHLTKVSKTSRN
jgi:hypothetical protein